MDEIRFKVVGKPRGKGSLVGRFAHHPKATVEWESLCRLQAADEMRARNLPVHEGPVELYLVVTIHRPKSHYGTGRNARKVKASAPGRMDHTQKPDYDKLARGVTDALTGIVYHDDSQVTQGVVRKEWCGRDEEQGVLVVARLRDPSGPEEWEMRDA